MPPAFADHLLQASDDLKDTGGLKEFSKSMKNWADGISLILLTSAFLVLGLNPKRYLWWRWKRFILPVCVLFVLIAWTLFRFFTEGIFDTAGPREFMVVTIGYVARWLWLAAEPYRRHKTRCRRWVRTVRALRYIPQLRLGRSTRPGRKGDYEVVIREAVYQVRRDKRLNSLKYWRGYEISAKEMRSEKHERQMCGEAKWLVQLQSETMHLESLEALLNVSRPWDTEDARTVLYKKIYTEVFESFPSIVDEEYGDTWSQKFIRRWGWQEVSRIAREAQATGLSPRSGIARKVAADAVYYTFEQHAEFRAEAQIKEVTEILRRLAENFWRRPPMSWALRNVRA